MNIFTANEKGLNEIMGKRVKLGEKFAFIKEACTFLLYDVIRDATFKKMKSLGLKTEIEVGTLSGTRQVDAVNVMLASLQHKKGMFSAFWDVGGYLLAMQALQSDSAMTEALSTDKTMGDVIRSLSDLNYDASSSESIINGIGKFIWDVPDALKLPHTGDWNKIPMNIGSPEENSDTEVAISAVGDSEEGKINRIGFNIDSEGLFKVANYV